MSGHSKWKNIMHKKGKTDAQRAKIFTKIGREIMVCVKEGGADSSTNSKLRDLIAKAKQNNVPNDNIDRVIKKAAGDGDKNSYETMVYEGYGPNGVAVIIEALTDNKNRIAGEVRHYFDKFGGNLGTSGCVSYMFTNKGIIIVENSSLSEEKVMEDCMEAGALDFSFNENEETIEVETPSSDCGAVREALEQKGYIIISSEVEQVPDTYVDLTDPEHIRKMNLLLDALDENEDVQNVFHNWDAPEDEEED